jgi:hypothetical protein
VHKRFNSNKASSMQGQQGAQPNLDPQWLTGFCDAEGCFSVIISKRNKFSWRVIVTFEINLHIKDSKILYKIKQFFGVGNVHLLQNKSKCVYRVTKIEDLINVIIPHFLAYPLLSQKFSDFKLWCKVVEIMSRKEHLTSTGFSIILNYYASVNTGLSLKVKKAFPNVKPVKKEKVKLPTKLNPNWISGFTAGDGGFSIGIRPNTKQIYFRFHICQHSRDLELMNLFIKFFNCGNVSLRINLNRCDYYVQDFSKICDFIITHFDNYPLFNIKSLDFLDFKEACQLFKEDRKNNMETIKKIISNMNSKRK